MTEQLEFLVDRLSTPIGELLIVADRAGKLRTIDWTDHEARMRQLLDRHYGKGSYRLTATRDPGGLTRTMRAYFKGDIAAIGSLPVATAGTPFQTSVWQALRRIKAGRTISYAELARRIGKPKAVRAVGLANGQNPDSGRANPHWQALVWLVQKAAFGPVAAAAGKLPLSFSPANASAAQQVSDQVAQNSTADWTTAEIKQTLIRLANTHTEFSDQKIAALSHACRAERLVMGLDRLLAALPKADSPAGVSAQLDQLFRLVQSQPEFIPAIFARELATFAQLVGK